ncbi:DUF4376 domain-containing protein [Bradyrhizobium jicamae]|uniref:DUF4376 domain-containing protein n=1 Tax=Bradyrhizobium jicamae TaxID=280332 RepID=UPI001BADC5E7|nr:DUF4376 domain-containing protein [Bradyrhizobium jicamae]MBR0753521.1 DUF4376 domain-containing protein [Bradyrhizobium jicamae]
MFNPFNWYWRADDGRIFASARQQIVDETDPDFIAFAEVQAPTTWPRDNDGTQTDAALQGVLDPYFIFVTLEAYAANERWKLETGGIASTAGVPLKTDDRGKTMIIGAGLLATNDPNFTTTWVGADGELYPLTNDQLKQQVGDLQHHIDACFVAYTDIVTQVRQKKITSHQQIDERFKAVKG